MGGIGFTHQAYLPHVLVAAFLILLLFCVLVWRRNSKLGARSRHNKGRIYGTPRMLMAGFACSLIGLCLGLLILGPYVTTKERRNVYDSVDIVIADDKSISVLAQATADKCGPSRLEIAQREIEKFVDLVEKDRSARLGLVVFTRFGYRYVPVLTKDYRLFRRMLKEVNEDELRTGGLLSGTNHWDAVAEAGKIFATGKVRNNRVLIIITDGEPDAPDEVLAKSQMLAMETMGAMGDIAVYVVGVGNPNVAYPIPRRRDAYGCPTEYFVQEEGSDKGKLLMTQPDVYQLNSIAAQLKGTYLHSRTGSDLAYQLGVILEKERRLVGTEVVKRKHDVTAQLVKITLLLLLVLVILKTP